MPIFIPEIMTVGHAPGFALWVARLAQANGDGETTVIYLADGAIESDFLRPNIELARQAGVDIRPAGVAGERYEVVAGRRACDWCTDNLSLEPGDRLIVPTVDLMLDSGCLPIVPSGVDLDVIFHQPGTQARMIPPRSFLKRRRTGIRNVQKSRRRARFLRAHSPNRTFVLDTHEFLGPGRRRFMRRFESLDPRLLPIESLNTEGYEPHSDARRTLGLPTEGPMLVVVGGIGLADGKGRDTLLDAWPEVRRGSPDATLAVLGGRVGDDSSATVSDEGDGVFRLARPLLQAEYLGMIEAASVVWAVRDRVEGMSSTVGVAMHFGRPTLVSSLNVSSSWCTRGAGGERVDPGDPRSIARGILRAFDASHVGRIDNDFCLGGFAAAVDALAGRRRFMPEDLPDRLRTGKRTG